MPLVLIANDQEWSARSLESLLSAEGYAVARAFTAAQALQRALTTEPDLIVLDRQMPDLDGVEICRRLRAEPRIGPAVPIIMTTAGQAGRAERLEALRAGAWDFLTQPFDAETIMLRVRSFIAARLAMKAAREAGLLDESTGLYTPQGLERRAKEIVSQALRTGLPVVCLVFGLDARAINGNGSADLAAAVSTFFRSQGRRADAVGRLGPLEFGVVAPATSPDGAARLLERIEASLPTMTSPGRGSGARLTLRVGYASLAESDRPEPDAAEIITRAAVAMRADLTTEARPVA
ncbi:MAG: response regulator [Gemmatimonadales bacterium]